MNFDQAFHKLLGHEGAYSNHPNDPGGETMWGVTIAVARQNGYAGAMKDMPVDVAKRIYKAQYWDAVRADEMPAGLRYPLFDAAVNSGVGQAIRWLQRALQLADDGRIGPITLAAAKQSNTEVIQRRMLSQRLRFMTNLSNWSSFSRGWARRIADLLEA